MPTSQPSASRRQRFVRGTHLLAAFASLAACGSPDLPFDPSAFAPWSPDEDGGALDGRDAALDGTFSDGSGDGRDADANDASAALDGGNGLDGGDADALDGGATDVEAGGDAARDGATDAAPPRLGRAETEPQARDARVFARRVWAGAERVCHLSEGVVVDGAQITREAPRRVCTGLSSGRDDPFSAIPNTLVPDADAMYALSTTDRVGEYFCMVERGVLRCSESFRGGTTKLPPAMDDVASVAIGPQFLCVVTLTGAIRCVSNLINGAAPLPPPTLTGVRKVGVGRLAACALSNEGVTCFRLTGASTPLRVPPLVRPRDIAVARELACALDDSQDPDRAEEGGVVCWDMVSGESTRVPRSVRRKRGWARILMRDWGTCVADADEVQCWGEGFAGDAFDAQRFRVPELIDFDFYHALRSSAAGHVCFTTARDGVTCRDRPLGTSPTTLMARVENALVTNRARTLPLSEDGRERLVCLEDRTTPTTGVLYRVSPDGTVRRIDDALCASLRVAPGGAHYLYRKGVRLWLASAADDSKRELFAWPDLARCSPDSVSSIEACNLAREARLTDAHEYFADFAAPTEVVISRRTAYVYEGLASKEWDCWRSPSRPSFGLFCYDRFQRRYAFDRIDIRTNERATVVPNAHGLANPHLSADRSKIVYQTAEALLGAPEDSCANRPDTVCPLKRVCPSGVTLRAFDLATGADQAIARAEGERCENPFPTP
jgi:hypothetical protein